MDSQNIKNLNDSIDTINLIFKLNKSMSIIADLKDNSLRLDKELAEANADKFPACWEDASESSYAHTCHIQLMERLKREFNI